MRNQGRIRYIDAPVLRDRDSNDNGTLDETVYYTTDANMNVTALVDTSGTVLERVVYDPYGNPTFYDGSWTTPAATSSYDNVVLYCGYHLDPETGLYHVRHRMSHASLGRWNQRDPAGYVDGMGLYEYVWSAPIGNLDPSGLSLITSADPDMYQNSLHKRAANEFLEAESQFLEKLVVMSGQVRSMWDHCCSDDKEFAQLVWDWDCKVNELTNGGVWGYSGTGAPGAAGWGDLGAYGLPVGTAGTLVTAGGALKAWASSGSSVGPFLTHGGNALGVAGVTLDACSAVQNFQAGDTDRAAGDTAMAIAGIGGLAGGPLLAIPVGAVGIGRGLIHRHFDKAIECADREICEDAKQQYRRYEKGYDRAKRRVEDAYENVLRLRRPSP